MWSRYIYLKHNILAHGINVVENVLHNSWYDTLQFFIIDQTLMV